MVLHVAAWDCMGSCGDNAVKTKTEAGVVDHCMCMPGVQESREREGELLAKLSLVQEEMAAQVRCGWLAA